MEEMIYRIVVDSLPVLCKMSEKMEPFLNQKELSSDDLLPLQAQEFLKDQIVGIEKGQLGFLSELRAGAALISSFVFFQKPINLLYAEAKGGNDEAFFNLVSLDKSMMTTDWGVARIRKAEITSDKIFFKKLSKAQTKNLRITKRRQIKLATIIFLFWPLGFKDSTYLERVEFLEAAGFTDDEIPSEDTLRQQINRWRISDLWKELDQWVQSIIDDREKTA